MTYSSSFSYAFPLFDHLGRLCDSLLHGGDRFGCVESKTGIHEHCISLRPPELPGQDTLGDLRIFRGRTADELLLLATRETEVLRQMVIVR